jgi:putative transposase
MLEMHFKAVKGFQDAAIHYRRPVHRGGLVHHFDRGSQYISIKYTERLVEAGIEPSVGSIGDPYGNALAETINGLYKAEIIHRKGPSRNFGTFEYATLEGVDWLNRRRLEPSGNITPDEAEQMYYAALGTKGKHSRLLDDKYGPGNYGRGAAFEFNKIQKWGDRAFQ